MLIDEILENLRDHLKERIRRGEFTERGLARRAALSQAHVHNVLKGRRAMTARVADSLMRGAGISATMLIPPAMVPRKGPGSALVPDLAYRRSATASK